MQILQQPNGNFTVEFETQSGTTGSVSLQTVDRGTAEALVEETKVRDLEKVSQVVSLTHQIVSQIVSGRVITLREGIAIWRERVLARFTLGKHTVYTHQSALTQLATFVGEDTPLVAITPEMIGAFVNRGHEMRSTALRKLASIKSFFNFLFNEGIALRNPAAKELVRVSYEPFSHDEKEQRVKEVFSPAEIERLYSACRLPTTNRFWLPAVTFGLETGLRLTDIAQLEWRSVASERVIVWTDKTNTRVDLALTPAISNAIASIPATGIQYLFPDERDIVRDPARRAYLSVQFSRLCKRAEVVGKSFHSIRHTYATRNREAGLTMEQVAANLGHRSTTTTAIYVHDRGSNPSQDPDSCRVIPFAN